MASVHNLLQRKSARVHTIGPQATALDAAMLMNEHQIGSLVVIEQNRVVGILTERDVLRRIVARRRDPGDTLISDVMTRHVVCCDPQSSVEQAQSIMMRRRVRHLPVIDQYDQLLGLISIGDLNAWQIDGQEREIHYLHQYVHGRI